VGETSEPSSVEIDGERLIGGAERIDTHVELAAAEEKRIEEIALADVGFGRVVAVEGLPAGDVCDFVEDEDALALALGSLSGEGVTGFIIQRERLSFWVRLNSS
jgi:nucleotide-binding universal stress UspA family protein